MSFDPFLLVAPAPATQCAPATFQWTGGAAPFVLVALDTRTNVVVETVATGVTGTTFISPALALPQDSVVTFQITDAEGHLAKTRPVAIGPSSDTSCLPRSLQPTVSSVISSSRVSPTSLPSASPSPSHGPKFTTQTGVIVGSIACALVFLAMLAAAWYWCLTRRNVRRATLHLKASFVTSRPPTRAETPMWGNSSARTSKLSLSETDSDATVTAAPSTLPTMEYKPQSILEPSDFARRSPPPPQDEKTRSTPPRLPSIGQVGAMDITSAYSWPYGHAPDSPPLSPLGGLTPMPPPRSTRIRQGTRSRIEHRDSAADPDADVQIGLAV